MGSYSFPQNTININAETYSSDNFRSATHVSTNATFGRQHLLDMNQNPCSSMNTTTTLDNDKGKEATSMRNKASGDSQHSENQAEDAILEAFNSNTMETIYNNSSQINEEVNKMFSSGDFQISQGGLGEPLENTLSVGRAAEINTRQIVPALPSSDQRPNLNDDSSARKRSKKRTLIETEAVPEEARERSLVLDSGGRTSLYRGVTRHRWTGRFEAHLWDNSEKRAGQSRKGRQVYLGGYDSEEKAARAFDLASLRFWGPSTPTNFPVASYEREIEEMQRKGKYEYVTILRRRSSGFSRGASTYRGVTRHHQNGRWQARIGRVAGNKDLYLGTYATQEEAAEAYDIATIKYRGQSAVTNFDLSRYDVPKIMSTPLPIGGLSKRMRMEEASAEITVDVDPQDEDESTVSSKGDSAISMSGNAFSASTETNGVAYQQEENPRMTSYQGGHLPNEADIFNFPSQLHPASYEKYLQLQSMLASNGQFQYNLMGLNPAAINTGNNRLPPPVIYKNIAGNPSTSNGLMSLDYSFAPSNTSSDYSYVPSNTLPSATGNSYAHIFNANLNGIAGLMPEGTENMFERFSGHSGPHGFETQMANAQQDGTFCSGFRTQGCMK